MKIRRTVIPLLLIPLLHVTFTISAAQKTVALTNGKDLSGWKVAGKLPADAWKIGEPALDAANPMRLVAAEGGKAMVVCTKAPNLVSEQKFTDCVLEMEFMLAKNANAGVKMMTLYEIQLLDSYGKPALTATDCGAIYKESPPKVNACRKAGEWQKLVIDFRAPRFDASGVKTANAKFVKVTLNGQVIQENFDIAHGTNVPVNTKEHAEAGILLQGDHGPVAFRNIKVTPQD